MMLDKAFPGGKMDSGFDCYYDDDIDPVEMTWEMRQFRKSSFEQYFMDACAGKQYCAVNIPNDVFSRISLSAQVLN